ncbi:MAG TPA: alpha/beta hydrolase [Bryobacteraceae bacterium]|jgi:pimeloyl-ACP methyl ester carboxylesterase
MRSVLVKLAGVGSVAALTLTGRAMPMPTVLPAPQSATGSPGTLRESAADLPGVRLWYTDSGGSGVPVVFMHAATGSVRNWNEHQVGPLTKAGYRFIAFDRRGWGRTVVAPSGPQPGTAADDLEDLAKHLGIDRFHLVGTAAGGFVALDYAVSYASRLRSLVVANSIGGVQDEEYLELGRRLRPASFNALPPDLRELGPTYRAANPDGTRRWLELEAASRPQGPPAPAQPMKNRMTFALLEPVKVPTLLLTGGADMYAPPPLLRLFAARIKGSETVVVPEAGHSSYWEQPDVFNKAVLDFIRKH